MNPKFPEALNSLCTSGERFVCVTIVAAKGSFPQEIGAKILVTQVGRYHGTVGGGRVEEAAIAKARELLLSPNPPACVLVEWNLKTDVGMTCGGVVSLLFEMGTASAWTIAIFGAGHVSQALCRILVSLDCRLLVFDTRPELAGLLPSSPKLSFSSPTPLEDGLNIVPDEAFVALMTHGHRSDRPVLEKILKTRNFPYLGVIGSKSKAAVLKRELREGGVDPAKLDAFRCPIGLDLGNDTPEEIAVSIAAEMIQVRK